MAYLVTEIFFFPESLGTHVLFEELGNTTEMTCHIRCITKTYFFQLSTLYSKMEFMVTETDNSFYASHRLPLLKLTQFCFNLYSVYSQLLC